MKIAVLSNINLDPLGNHLKKGFDDVYLAGYNQYLHELNNEHSRLRKDAFDVILLHLDGSEFFKNSLYTLAHFDDSRDEFEEDIRFLFSSIEQFISEKRNCLFILNTLSVTPYIFNSFLERNSDYSLVSLKDRINQEISTFAQRSSNILVMDWERIVLTHGYDNLYDERYWYLGRIKYNNLAFESMRRDLEGLIKAYTGNIRKVIVLDIDNTLWGGVIGEDGLEGIELSEEGAGKAYRDFQKNVKAAKDLGILLSLCSKNNFDDVREAFENHPMMVLTMDDFVSVKINWTDKVTNLQEIAQELNLGLDSFVFIDDNPVERELVKEHLPELGVPEFPLERVEIPRWFIQHVLYHYFPKVFLTTEDTNKTTQYTAKADRERMREKLDMNSFLRNLKIKLNISVDDRKFIDRTAQMTQKTNQFNLTTKRYAKSDIENMLNSDSSHIFNLAYEDRFGSEGIVGTAIVNIFQDQARIDSLLLSCRVIGREIEYAFLKEIIQYIRGQYSGIHTVTAEYIPTRKNIPVKDFYEKAGFDLVQSQGSSLEKIYSKEISSLLGLLSKKIDTRAFQ